MLLTKMRIINWSIKVLENPDKTKDMNQRKVEIALWRLRLAQYETRNRVAKICFPDSAEESPVESNTPPSRPQGVFAQEGELYLTGYYNN